MVDLFFDDPAGNDLEFKAMRDLDALREVGGDCGSARLTLGRSSFEVGSPGSLLRARPHR